MNTATQHFMAQRISAVVLAVLSLWFVSALKTLKLTDPTVVVAWIQKPRILVLLLLLIGSLFYHAFLGIQVVIEDYVPNVALRRQNLDVSQWVFLGLAALSAVFLLMLSVFGMSV
jgi:succinate dehydrogenase / fumarate reductase, membrane anchor subunit